MSIRVGGGGSGVLDVWVLGGWEPTHLGPFAGGQVWGLGCLGSFGLGRALGMQMPGDPWGGSLGVRVSDIFWGFWGCRCHCPLEGGSFGGI